MKKIILFTLALFATVTCFARDRDDDDKRTNSFKFKSNSDTALMINFGDTFYNTERIEDYFSSNQIWNTNGFTGEIGTFRSDEDGLFDFVQTSLFGFGGGKIFYVDNQSGCFDDIYFAGNGDPKHFNFYFKETLGLQVNAFFVSFGITTGPKAGFDWMTIPAHSERYENLTFHENRLFLDWTLNPYVSLNLHNIKLFVKADTDFPILRIRFKYNKATHYKSGTDVSWDWFKNDVPISYMIGCAIFF